MGKRISLYTNNQSIIKALASQKATSGQYLINTLKRVANKIGQMLEIRWISSHSKVKGNKVVDKLAKEAAAGCSSTRLTLPHRLRTPLPASASTLKQKFMLTLKERWSKAWDASPQRVRIDQLGGNFPYTAHKKQLLLLPRRQASLMLQI